MLVLDVNILIMGVFKDGTLVTQCISVVKKTVSQNGTAIPHMIW